MDSDQGDLKFKSYTAQVDKSLKGFEYSTEWADLISALGRLIKVIQSNSKTNYVPRSLLVGKRLAQCLHPALPPGVHCKALECYDVIFRTIGSRNMSLDLPVYGSGLFTLLGPSAMAVKPPLFDIFEEHLLPLGCALQPAFLGLLEGILPGLEQGAEFSERGNRTIEMFCASVGPEFFYTSLWKLMMTTPSVRHFGISFVLNHFNKRKPLNEQAFLYGRNKRILLRSLCCLFGDSVLLVQRDALEFLQSALPIHFLSQPGMTIAGSELSKSDFVFLCRSALCVLLRRDASLNRRLFSWLRGTQPIDTPRTGSFSTQPMSMAHAIFDSNKEESSEHNQLNAQDEYFQQFSRNILTDAVRQIIEDPYCLPLFNGFISVWGCGSVTSRTAWHNAAIDRSIAERPYRIVAGLLDRSDIGGVILEDVLPDLLWFTYAQYHSLKKQTLAWTTHNSPSVVSQGMTRIWDGAGQVDDVVNLIADHVINKDATKSICTVLDSYGDSTATTTDSASNQPTDTHQTDKTSTDNSESLTNQHPPDIANEFLRSAQLFLSNLDSDFLWNFIQCEFGRLIPPVELSDGGTRRSLSLNRLCRVVHFLLTQFPIETYTNVCSVNLPQLASHLINCLMKHVESSLGAGVLSTPEFNSVLCVLDSLIDQISKYVLAMFDRSAIFSFGSTSPNTVKQDGTRSLQSETDLQLLASMIGDFRQFLGLFCIHILDFSTDEMSNFLQSIVQTSENRDQPRGSSTNEKLCQWLDLFSQLCRLLLQMSNFPLLVVCTDEPSLSDPEGSHPNKFMQLFRGHLLDSQNGNDVLPQWLVCLLYAAVEVDYFDMKAISMYTLLELFCASSSVHGYGERERKSSTSADPVKNTTIRWRLTFPVLSGDVLSYLMNRTNVFVRMGTTLWAYLSPSQYEFHEDTANLLLGLHHLSPKLPSKSGSVVETFILSQMLSPDLRTQVDAQSRFALLWHLMRPSAFQIHSYRGAQGPNGSRKTALVRFCSSLASPCWRRYLLRNGSHSRAGLTGPISKTSHRTFPFYRCGLILLDNLDFDSPWGPVGPIGSAGFSSRCHPTDHDLLPVLLDSVAERQNIGLVRSVLREQAVQWVLRALRAGQVDRLVAPILAALLHPATVRVSLKSRVVQENRRLSRGKKHSTDSHTKEDSDSGLSNSADSTTLEHENGQEDQAQSMNIFSFLQSKLDEDLLSDGNAKKHLNGRNLASALLKDLLTVSTTQSAAYSSLKSCVLVADDEPPSILPLHEHLLVHLQSYDANQMVYALSRLRAILFVAPTLFVEKLAVSLITNDSCGELAGTSVFFGLSLPELLTRHHRALTGANFYSSTTTDDSRFAQVSLLEVIVSLCIMIMSSQLPYSTAPPSANKHRPDTCGDCSHEYPENEFRANKCAQKTAAEVLELIVKELGHLQGKSSHHRNGTQRNPRMLQSMDSHALTANGRQLVEGLLGRTCLTSAILHCLATGVEVAHWPSEIDRWMTDMSESEFKALPLCMRLLLVNEYAANLPEAFHSLHLSSLIRLAQAVLQLQPWAADRIEATIPKSLMLNTIWSMDEKPPQLSPQLLLNIWLNGFRSLPKSFPRMALLKSVCLSAHWSCPQLQSSHPVREQGALLLDVFNLALSNPSMLCSPCPVVRRDLHPMWYQFVLSTLSCWGLFTPQVTRVVVGQLCANLLDLAQHAVNGVVDLETDEFSSHDRILPPDYVLSSLACLQSIYHALLLPGGSVASALLFWRSSLNIMDDQSCAGASELAGLPDSVLHASFLADKLASLHQSAGTKPFTAVEPGPDSSTFAVYRNTQSDSLVDGDTERSILSSAASFAEGGATVNVNTSSVTFTNRAKDLFSSNGTPDPDSHPLVQAQTELIRQFPSVLNMLALLWDAYNILPLVDSTDPADQSLPPEARWPPNQPVNFGSLPLLTALGSPDSVQPALRRFLDPIARQNPASFLINLAIAWPSNLLNLELNAPTIGDTPPPTVLSLLTPALKPNPDLLPNPSELTSRMALPLLPRQVSLLRLLSGYITNGAHFGPVLPIASLVAQLRELVKRPCTGVALLPTPTGTVDPETGSATERKNILTAFATRVQTNLLHIFYALLDSNIHPVPADLLLTLLRDLICLPVAPTANLPGGSSGSPATITPVAVFVLVKIFNRFLQVSSTSDDRREQRELQELCHRLLESTASVAASALKQPTWFRRTHQVASPDELANTSSPLLATEVSQPQANGEDEVAKSLSTSQSSSSLLSTNVADQTVGQASTSNSTTETMRLSSSNLNLPELGTRPKYSSDLTIQAMELLTEHMSGFLDIVYRSEEKDRVPTFLTGLLSIIFPYLRVRMQSNSKRFTAASKILASVSSYQYTRRAWRKEVLDLFYEPVFFQMAPAALHSWNSIIDNLMTQDKSTFREVLARLAFSQPGTLNLFASKEAEHDLRAACLKKLSYVVYASEPDQYAKAMPDLLERLTECLRLSSGIVPQVHAEVFLFARTLIARMSAMQLTSLWPIVIPELITVFKAMLKYLKQSSEKSQDKKSPTTLSAKENNMYLGACKLLATGIATPGFRAPQFSFYEWIFVNSSITEKLGSEQPSSPSKRSSLPTFTPLLTEIYGLLRRMNQQEDEPSGITPLQGCLHALSLKQITVLSDLLPFIRSLENPCMSDRSQAVCDSSLIVDVALEAALALEFPEPIVAR